MTKKKKSNGLSDFRQATMEALIFCESSCITGVELNILNAMMDMQKGFPVGVQNSVKKGTVEVRLKRVKTALLALHKLKFVDLDAEDNEWTVCEGVREIVIDSKMTKELKPEIVTKVEPDMEIESEPVKPAKTKTKKPEKTGWQAGLSDNVCAAAVTWAAEFVERVREHKTLGKGSGSYVDDMDDDVLAEYCLTMWYSGGTDNDKSGYSEVKLWKDMRDVHATNTAEPTLN